MNTANPPPMGQMGCRVGVFVCFYLLHLRVRLVVFSREDACVYVPDGLFLCDFWMCVCVCAHECVLLCVCVCVCWGYPNGFFGRRSQGFFILIMMFQSKTSIFLDKFHG